MSKLIGRRGGEPANGMNGTKRRHWTGNTPFISINADPRAGLDVKGHDLVPNEGKNYCKRSERESELMPRWYVGCHIFPSAVEFSKISTIILILGFAYFIMNLCVIEAWRPELLLSAIFDLKTNKQILLMYQSTGHKACRNQVLITQRQRSTLERERTLTLICNHNKDLPPEERSQCVGWRIRYSKQKVVKTLHQWDEADA